MAMEPAIDRASVIFRALMLIAMVAVSACSGNRAGQPGYIDHNLDGRFNPG